MGKKKSLNKGKYKKMKADEVFIAQLEDAWHLIEKRHLLGRKELMVKVESMESPDNKNES